MVKKIKIVIEDSVKGKIEIPFTIKEVRDLYDYGPVEIQKKFAKVIDASDEGKTVMFKDGKFVLIKNKFYHSGKKPQWKKKTQ